MPGPELRLREGELFRVQLENDLPDQPTSIHWHGLLVPAAMDGVPDMSMTPVPPAADLPLRVPDPAERHLLVSLACRVAGAVRALRPHRDRAEGGDAALRSRLCRHAERLAAPRSRRGPGRAARQAAARRHGRQADGRHGDGQGHVGNAHGGGRRGHAEQADGHARRRRPVRPHLRLPSCSTAAAIRSRGPVWPGPASASASA